MLRPWTAPGIGRPPHLCGACGAAPTRVRRAAVRGRESWGPPALAKLAQQRGLSSTGFAGTSTVPDDAPP